MSSTLKLTLHKKAFDVMVTGEKTLEYRRASKWIESRLFDRLNRPRSYDFIQYTNGYGSNSPVFICEFAGFERLKSDLSDLKFSNGLIVSGLKKGDYVISNGLILYARNLK